MNTGVGDSGSVGAGGFESWSAKMEELARPPLGGGGGGGGFFLRKSSSRGFRGGGREPQPNIERVRGGERKGCGAGVDGWREDKRFAEMRR